MRFTVSALLLAAAVGCGSSDTSKTDDAKKVDKNSPPEVQFADLNKRYLLATQQFQMNAQASPGSPDWKKMNDEFQAKHEQMAQEALALAKANPKADFCLEAVKIAANDTTTDAEALKFAVDTFGDDRNILDLVPMLASRPDGAPLLANLGESKSKDVRGGAQYMQVMAEIEKLERSAKAKPADQEKGFAAAAAKLDAVVKEYGDVTVMGEHGPAKLADAAKDVIFMLEHLRVGKTLADVDCPTLDGKTAKISDYSGKVVVLDIWATWCPPCRAMIPHERDMVKKLEGKPFALISVSADDTKETLTKFLETTPMPWTHWHAGPGGELLKKYQVKFFPTIYVLDAKGVIRYKNVRNQDLEHAVEELLKETNKTE